MALCMDTCLKHFQKKTVTFIPKSHLGDNPTPTIFCSFYKESFVRNSTRSEVTMFVGVYASSMHTMRFLIADDL